jgi:hypothetical protein
MTQRDDDEDVEAGDAYPDTLGCVDGDVHFGVDAQTFLIHWLAKLGFEPAGSALMVGEGMSLAIIHPETGEALTPMEIAKRAKAGKIRSVQ